MRIFDLTPQSAFNIVQSAAQKAGLGAVAPHDLRRSAAKSWLDAGATIAQISQILGHGSIQTTERYLSLEIELRPGLAATDLVKF